MNKIILTGRITADPELRSTQTGKYVSQFNLAVNRLGASEGQQGVDFITIVLWNKLAENFCKYQKKGNLILVEGELRLDNYKDKDGNSKTKVYVLSNNVEYLSKVEKKEESESSFGSTGTLKQDEIELSDDDLPF